MRLVTGEHRGEMVSSFHVESSHSSLPGRLDPRWPGHGSSIPALKSSANKGINKICQQTESFEDKLEKMQDLEKQPKYLVPMKINRVRLF